MSAAVSICGATFWYPASEQPALEGIDLDLAPGSWTLVCGPSGSGKSTLALMLAGLIPRHSAGTLAGQVRLFGFDPANTPPQTLAGLVGLIQQSPDEQICAHTVEGELAFGLANLGMTIDVIEHRIDQALADAELERFRHAPVDRLSGGEKQRLVLAAILAMRPRLVVCDEPCSQLDPQAAADLLDRLSHLHALGATLVTIEHRLDELYPRAQRLVVLDQGRIVGDAPTDDPPAARQALSRARLAPPELMELARRAALGPAAVPEQLAAEVRAVRGEEVGAHRSTSRGDSAVEPHLASAGSHVPATPHEAPPRPRPNQPRGAAVVEADGIAYQHAPGVRPLWTDLALRIEPGELVALVGPNGSGKSTLLAVLAGLLEPSAGRLLRPPDEPHRLGSALVMQNPDLMLLCPTVADELAFGPRQLGMPQERIASCIVELSEAFGLSSLLGEAPLGLSRGQRLRVAVAASLAAHPRLVLLDEPTTGQDTHQVQALMQRVLHLCRSEHEPPAVLFSTHDLRIAVRFAQRVLVLAEGRLLADLPPKGLVADHGLLAAARLRLTPLLRFREALGLRGTTVEQLAAELNR